MAYFDPYDQCPICESPQIQFWIDIYYWRENLLQFFRCRECLACFANPMPAHKMISDGNNALVRWDHKDRTFEHEFRDARQAYLRGKLLGRRLQRWKPNGVLLDIGCY